MPRLAPKPVKLEDTERQQLQQLINRHNTPQQLALRAKIIVLAEQGLNHREIARSLNISRDMARLWRERWLASGEKEMSVAERLQDGERPGAPATFSLEQILQLFAIGCEQPETYGRPISSAIGRRGNWLWRWSNRALWRRFRLGMWGDYWKKLRLNRTNLATG